MTKSGFALRSKLAHGRWKYDPNTTSRLRDAEVNYAKISGDFHVRSTVCLFNFDSFPCGVLLCRKAGRPVCVIEDCIERLHVRLVGGIQMQLVPASAMQEDRPFESWFLWRRFELDFG